MNIKRRISALVPFAFSSFNLAKAHAECVADARKTHRPKYLAKPFVAIALLALSSGMAQATIVSFSDPIDFSGTGTDNGPDDTLGGGDDITYLTIGNNSSSFSYDYIHNTGIGSSSGLLEYGSVTLTITHRGNSNGGGEFWFATEASSMWIGSLGTSNNIGTNDFLTETFALSNDIVDLIQNTNPWMLSVKFNENTGGRDTLDLASSLLSGRYDDDPCIAASCDDQSGEVGVAAAIPVPGTLTLLGLSFISLVFRRSTAINTA